MNIWEKTKEVMWEERSSRSSIEQLFKYGRLNDDELKARLMDHDYHFETKFKMIWEDLAWETQLALAVHFYANVYYRSFLDSAQETAYKLLI